jgi:hypothetical protein
MSLVSDVAKPSGMDTYGSTVVPRDEQCSIVVDTGGCGVGGRRKIAPLQHRFAG